MPNSEAGSQSPGASGDGNGQNGSSVTEVPR